MRNYYIVRISNLVCIVTLILSACSGAKDVAQETPDNQSREKDELFTYNTQAKLEKFSDSLLQSSQPVTVDTMYYVNDSLHLWVRYGGGCEHHHFELYGSYAVMKSYPPKRSIFLVNQSEPDHCRALLKKKLVFDISTLYYEYKRSGIHLLLNDKSVFIPPAPMDPKNED